MRLRKSTILLALVLATVLTAVVAYAGLKGKLYVKLTETLLTERAGQLCRGDNDEYCERNYQCPKGMVAHALIYNVTEDQGAKRLAGLSLVCSDPNAFSNPQYVGPAGDGFAGEAINDYCPVGYLLAGAEFFTADRHDLTGARRVCRRYRPYDQRKGANVFGAGFDSKENVCPADHWVTGLKASFKRGTDDNGHVDSQLINARFYCSEMRHYLIEPDKEELEQEKR